MAQIGIAFLGDVVGQPGRRAAAHAAAVLRERNSVSAIVANVENAKNGSGISPDLYREMLRSGIDACTLGDHAYRERTILKVLQDPAEPISRPANLALEAPGKRVIRIELPDSPPLYIVTVLGRLFMPVPADNPFAVVDRELTAILDRDAIVLVEVHAEASSEKQAMAWHCAARWSGPKDPRVVGVIGTHTHVQTADARLIDHTLAAMTDVGMCGPHRSVIGRAPASVVRAMAYQEPVPLEVAADDARACGCLITIETQQRRAISIQPIAIDAPAQ